MRRKSKEDLAEIIIRAKDLAAKKQRKYGERIEEAPLPGMKQKPHRVQNH